LIPKDITLRDLQSMALFNQALNLNLKALLCDNYEDFCEVVHDCIDEAVDNLQKNRNFFQGMNENQITINIIHQLTNYGLGARFEANRGGHCDVVVENRFNHTWLGEAKIDRNISWVHDGFHQLNSRYISGGKKDTSGGILIYCLHHGVADFMKRWRERLMNDTNYSLSWEQCQRDLNAFYSYHSHRETSRSIKVRHIPVQLRWDPGKS